MSTDPHKTHSKYLNAEVSLFKIEKSLIGSHIYQEYNYAIMSGTKVPPSFQQPPDIKRNA